MSGVARKGWCPGALRPMRSGDGWLVRLRIANGALSLSQAAALARAADLYGNGLVDLSARGNLQLRGVRDDSFEPLLRVLGELGLLDADATSEAVRNVTPSPLAGLDDAAILDARPLVSALEDRLGRDEALRALPAKFGFLVDGGGRLPLTNVASDVRFEAFAGAAGPRLALRLATTCVGALDPREIVDVAARVAQAFLTLRRDETRMAALVARIGAAAVAAHAGIAMDQTAPAAAPPIARGACLGGHRHGAQFFVGAAMAFGSFRAQDLAFLAERAGAQGARELRLTVWRAVLVPGLSSDAAFALAADLTAAGFILDPADPRLALAACAGEPACASAHADVRATALRLAPLLGHFGGVLHVSGCAKGCAHHARAPLALVATPTGFDLIADGYARDRPIERDLDPISLAAHVARRLAGAPS